MAKPFEVLQWFVSEASYRKECRELRRGKTKCHFVQGAKHGDVSSRRKRCQSKVSQRCALIHVEFSQKSALDSVDPVKD